MTKQEFIQRVAQKSRLRLETLGRPSTRSSTQSPTP